MTLPRKQIIPLIERYHASTREARSHWYAAREEISRHTRREVSEIIQLLQQPDAPTRSIARDRLDTLASHISNRISDGTTTGLMEIFGWVHFHEMNLYGDDADSRANARSFAGALEPLLAEQFTRDDSIQLLLRLYGSNIKHIGPGLTGLLYFLQPSIFPVLGQKALRGVGLLFDCKVRTGKEALKHLESHLKLIWDLVDSYADVIDVKDMADVSGFLYWIEISGSLQTKSKGVNEKPAEYRSAPLEDTPLALTADQMKRGIEEISLRLAIDSESIEQAVVSLLTGKSLILTGPPGTGKTELARMIPSIFWNYFPMVTTATAEWTAYEVIGGIFPQIMQKGEEQHLAFTIRKGCVYEAIELNWEPLDRADDLDRRRSVYMSDGRAYDGVWLIIDEFNRADIDKAFGDLFTSLETGMLRVPEISEDDAVYHRPIPIPQQFRIIGTLNTFDRHHLFEMSDALKRRFAFVDIKPHPDITVEKHLALDRSIAEIRRRSKDVDRVVLQEIADILFEWIRFVRIYRLIGTAQLITVLTYCGLRLSFSEDRISALSEGIISNIVPQLEGLSRDQLNIISRFADGALEPVLFQFEQRLRNDIGIGHELQDLQRFAGYLVERSSGAQRILATEISRLISEGGDDVQQAIVNLIEGDEAGPEWRDAFCDQLTLTRIPAVAGAIKELSDESI